LAGANLFVSAEQLREAVASGVFAWKAPVRIFGQIYKSFFGGMDSMGWLGPMGLSAPGHTHASLSFRLEGFNRNEYFV
jgi:hypothetical protein